MNPNVPIGNQKEQVKSYRQLKSEELEGLVLDLESNSVWNILNFSIIKI